ncbi:carboxypeptidase-like regulatory domain-containing protein [Bacteroidota bacterium]
MKALSLLFLLITILLFSIQNSKAQNTFTLSGTVKDASTGEVLIGVAIVKSGSTTGTITNEKGYYSLNLPGGKHQISYSYMGYKTIENEVYLKKDETLNIQLSLSAKVLDEVEIQAEKKDYNIKSTEMSMEKMKIGQIEVLPIIMGETDIMKAIQLTPGVTTITEGRSGFVVRGGGLDQNLILMDDMPLYYSSHMQGLYSVYNSDAVDDLKVYKGGIPAHFGGRAASVLEVKMRESDPEVYHAKLSAGLITSKLSVEAPFIKDKLSVFVAYRTTKLSLGRQWDVLRGNQGNGKGGKSGGGVSSDAFFFFGQNESWMDINTKIIYKINDKNSIRFSGYFGRDSALTAGGLTEWGNRAGILKWNHQFSDRFQSNTSLIYSKYYTEAFGGLYHFKSCISTPSFRQDFSYFLNDKNEIKFGITTEYQSFNHGELVDTESNYGKFMPPMQGLESALYIENDQKINAWFSVYYGLRYSMYHQLGPGDGVVYDDFSNEPISSTNYPGKTDVMAFYHKLEPRLASTFIINEKSSFKASYNRNAQYLRLMTMGMELQWYDIWMPTSSNIEPMVSDQVAMGYFRNFKDNEFKFSVETYYKWVDGAADFEDGLHNYLVDNLEAYVATGKGRAYGLELMLKKPYGKLNGWISYNLGRSEKQIDVINSGEWYPSMFDKTHDFTFVASYKIFENLTISTTFLFSSGNAITLPEAYYFVSGIPFPYWEGRNRYRIPDYHRLDFGVKYEPEFLNINLKKQSRTIKTNIELSLYNVYNRRNINRIEYSQYSADVGKGGSSQNHMFEPYGVSIYGFMPTFLINMQF